MDISKELVGKVVCTVLSQLKDEERPKLEIIVNVSARHVHLSQEHLEILFGKNHTLTPIRELMQPGEFAAKETVMIIGPKGVIQNVRVLGPLRSKTQVEISKTDGYTLGIDAPVRESGNVQNTPGCVLVGPMGAIRLEQGVICALRHVHMPDDIAKKWNLRNNQFVKVATCGDRKVIFDKVLVRVSPKFVLEMHLDTDEANASGVKSGDKVYLIN
ncbi:phosphate propanoyltransferase [Tepidanaerobacter sp. GT38]|uniref:phosphate propanoyltransferase n=1 Tax=Tepidanaerobacter sp. GT38 TaxID=2722793 RepID=UPI001F2A6B7A|nr:phosphate propanoyltransferase [Tepidanaerobacter sp. GT38]MCG1013017.1 phosphate propanoyltransferase [Tepidanaerobacter sp. GT38]